MNHIPAAAPQNPPSFCELITQGEIRALASRVVGAVIHFFTAVARLMVESCSHFKNRVVELFVERRVPVENLPLPDFSHIEELSYEQFANIPELHYWMVRNVGPYKPIGYIEHGLSGKAQEKYYQIYGKSNYGPERSAITLQILEDLKAKQKQDIASFTYDNNIVLTRNGPPLAYNQEALFEVLEKNQDSLSQISPTIQSLVQQKDKIESTRIFVEKVQRENIRAERLIQAAFGDRPRSLQDTSYLPQGIVDLAQLQLQFPKHNWITIRNFLVHFHRCTQENPVNATRLLLSQIPKPNPTQAYFIHNSRVHSANQEFFFQRES